MNWVSKPLLKHQKGTSFPEGSYPHVSHGNLWYKTHRFRSLLTQALKAHIKNFISRCNQKLMLTKQSEIQASPQNSPEYSLQGSAYLYSPYILLLYILPYIF